MIPGVSESVQDTDLESTVTSILSDIDVHVGSREVKDCHRIGKSNNGSKGTIIKFTDRKTISKPYCIGNAWKHLIIVSINLIVVQKIL